MCNTQKKIFNSRTEPKTKQKETGNKFPVAHLLENFSFGGKNKTKTKTRKHMKRQK